MSVTIKHFWLSESWAPPPPPPAVLRWKPLRDRNTGWKEFKPPEWQVLVE